VIEILFISLKIKHVENQARIGKFIFAYLDFVIILLLGI